MKKWRMYEKKRFLIIILYCILLIFIIRVGYATTFEECSIVDYNVYYKNGKVNDNLEHPLISYKDNTYISIRDIGKILKRDILWNEQYGNIILKQPSMEKNAIRDKKTAELIAKAIVSEKYSNKTTNTTSYYTTFKEPTAIWAQSYFEVFVFFDLQYYVDSLTYINNSDISVEIDPSDGSFKIFERQEDGRMKQV